LSQGRKKITEFVPNTNYPTADSSAASLFITAYASNYYINGVVKVLRPDVTLKDTYIHIIDGPITKAAPAGDPCDYCQKLTTVAVDVEKRFSKWYDLWSRSTTLPKTGVTLFPTVNAYYDEEPNLYNYLWSNETAADEYLSKFIVTGIYYPNYALYFSSLTTIDGTVITISSFDAFKLVGYINVNYTLILSAAPRTDGISYEVDAKFIDFPFPTPPAPEVAPDPPPIPEPMLPPQPASAVHFTFNLVFLVLGYLLVLFAI